METLNLRTVSQLTSAFAVLAILDLTAATLYVSLDSPNPSPPYATWATAAHVIQDAVAAASAGDQIVVTNGVYAGGAAASANPDTYGALGRIALTNAVVARSVNGPEVTIIEGMKTWDPEPIRGAYVGNGSVLSGFTLQNGDGGYAGGGAYLESQGVLTNCVLIGNNASDGGGAYGGTLYGCLLTGNSGSEGGRGA